MRSCQVRDLGRLAYLPALQLQHELVEKRKRDEIPDQILFVEHPPVITVGRNGHLENLLASPEILQRAGIEVHHCDRGGDVTFHGPGQIVGYPIFDLRGWKRDVVAFVRTLEQVLIEALADFGIQAGRNPGFTGVWVGERKIAAIGVHISRWVTSHGFALNHCNDLSYFQYIIPCGLTKPVTSMREQGADPGRQQVCESLARHFAAHFDLALEWQQPLQSAVAKELKIAV